MTRGNTQEVKMHYKGQNTGDDYLIYIASAQAVKDWVKDKTIPLVEVLDGFFVFVSHKYVSRITQRKSAFRPCPDLLMKC
jgi:hypothetical protein